MAQKDAGSRIAAGAVTIVGLSAVWLAIITSLPSQEELLANIPTVSSTAVPASELTANQKKPNGMIAEEPVLDLSIPGAHPHPSAAPSLASEQPESGRSSAPSPTDHRTAQVLRLKCEAEIEQLCPDMLDGPAKARCVERRAKELPSPCRGHVRERFVKWKEDRTRMLTACQEDVRRLCPMMNPGDGRVLQCLQDHAQEVSDGCYETLPKGRLLFRQQ